MPIFRRKSVVTEARQWTGANLAEMRVWLGYAFVEGADYFRILIENRDGRVVARPGDWIVKDEGFYPMEQTTFSAEYEAV